LIALSVPLPVASIEPPTSFLTMAPVLSPQWLVLEENVTPSAMLIWPWLTTVPLL
jgi:hypothetical protein